MVVVPDYQLSLAIGKKDKCSPGCQIIGWKIDIISESTYLEKAEQFQEESNDIHALK